ncbi:MAG: ABC transporter permease [Deltaproteobacteria bacterium]|nr:ABC transporter permease [Deltaproteobacteria bacterium]
MMRALAAAIGKDFRLLARDRVGLAFLTVAPIVVITVAGFSLASLYGAGPRGTTAYVLPIADEDGGRVGRAFRDALGRHEAVAIEEAASRTDAARRVERQRAGVALVIPRGASRTLAAGRPVDVELLTDPVKYLEVASLRGLVQEIRHDIERRARDRADRRLAHVRARMERTRVDFARAAETLAHELEALPGRLAAAHAATASRAHAVEARAARELRTALATATELQASRLSARLAAELGPLRRFVAELEAAETAFARWWRTVRRQAGRYADRLPPPPAPPRVPFAVSDLVRMDPDALAERLVGRSALPVPDVAIPSVRTPAPPALPTFHVPSLPEPPGIALPGVIEIVERSVTGAPERLNTFDQNVPGFSVTFLLLGMLLGVSLGLLDERDWGTLARLRTMPVALDVALLAKLVTRFVVGCVQMTLLLIAGRLCFGISLGPEPWALALPTAGIVFAGTAFGLVVAGLAYSREAVLPLGSIAIVTMAAVGGCWWPIDLEPRWMQRVALAFPTTWAMAAYNDLMIRRQPLAAALLPTGVLIAHGLAYLAVGLALFRRRGFAAP